MKIVIETNTFMKEADKLGWSEESIDEFKLHISQNPTDGELIVNSGGARKVRWALEGAGKSGGVRVITVIETADSVTLLTVYKKSVKSTIKGHKLRRIK